ncbi:unnamed protein product [Protopolystoma xenopodis]|uniref:Cilia- and flagella-associated protein 45 n=1 Tax=Protopolystoma xenopodis TaxID=117903 RepID=A0A448XNR3_9PLAT|nr:unnamed protein product [Protopolystoma xenopodis]
MKREAAYEEEQARIRSEKEKEVARLRSLQERARDEAAERDALRAKRAAEAAERDWRRQEMVLKMRESEVEAELKLAREAQAVEKQRLVAVQAARDRAEFERILRQASHFDSLKLFLVYK